jgi:hypothetical protein
MSCEAWRTAAFMMDGPVVANRISLLYTLLKKIDFSILRIGKNGFSLKKERKKEAAWSEKRGNDNIVYGKDTY